MARRISNHSGRKHKDGKVFSARHPDRNYNVKNDPHIDASLSCKNTYWMNPNLGFYAKTFDEFEQRFYEKYYAEYIIKTNEKHEKSRHYERMIDAKKMRNNSRTCVEDTLLYFGDKKNPLPDSVRDEIVSEYIAWHMERFPQCIILDYATHRDEPNSAIHTEVRCAWTALHDDGYFYPNQTKSLEQMGIIGNKQKKDNAKKEYTRMCRAKQAELLSSRGFSVELTPNQGKSGQELAEFKRDKAKEELAEQEKLIVHAEEKKDIESQIRQNRLNKDEVVMSKELANKLIVSSLERDRYKHLYEEYRNFKDESIDREKMNLRIQLNQTREELKTLKERFRDMNDCVKKFMEQRGLTQIFKQAVERYKREKEQQQKKFMQEQEIIRKRAEEQTYHRER